MGKIHNISTSIANYPNEKGEYGGEGRGTYATYDDKILHATGNKSLKIKRDVTGKLKAFLATPKPQEKIIARAELRGSNISLNIDVNNKEKATELIAEIIDTFKDKWGISKGTSIEYKLQGADEKFNIKYKDIVKS